MQVITSEVDGIAHRATPRNEAMMLVEIETDLVGMFSLAEQAIDAPYPKPGEKRPVHRQTIVIYEHQWPAVQRQVRTDAQMANLARAMEMAPADREIVERRKAAEAALARARTPSSRERAESELAGLENDIFRKALELLCTMPGCKDGLSPLLSARVIKSNVAPPPMGSSGPWRQR